MNVDDVVQLLLFIKYTDIKKVIISVGLIRYMMIIDDI